MSYRCYFNTCDLMCETVSGRACDVMTPRQELPPPGTWKLGWRRPVFRMVTSASRWRFPTLVRNTYPSSKGWFERGCTIGIALYWRHRGLSFLWGRPVWIGPTTLTRIKFDTKPIEEL